MKVALVCIAKNEENYIHEWIDYHLKLGFDRIFVYANDWHFESDNVNVEVIPFNGSAQQMPAYNHFLSNNILYDWAAFIDVDEFIVLKRHNNISDFIQEYGKETDGIAINWMFFGNNGHEKVLDNNYSVLNRFTKREESVNQHVKVIANARNSSIVMCNPHFFTGGVTKDTQGKVVIGPFNEEGSIDVAQINHYICKSNEEFVQKIGTVRADNGAERNFGLFDYFVSRNEIEDRLALDFYRG